MVLSRKLYTALLAGTAAATDDGPCSMGRFAKVLPEGATVTSATYVAAGGSYGEGTANLPYPIGPANLPATCALIVNVTSSATSFYRFGLFLPITTWNERYLAVGNGGAAGGINWLDMGTGLQYGFAVAGSDMGHNSTSQDISWALNEPERKLDFGFRATHGTTVLAKQLTEAFYASPIKYSYYSGCSTGGRQGLKEVQVYPDDFDGVMVGAAAWWTSHLQTWATQLGALNLPKNASHSIGPAMAEVIAAEVIAQCDGVDGFVDGIVSAPDLCNFDADALLCQEGANATRCLTASQVQTVKKIHGDYIINGRFAFPGLELGSEHQWIALFAALEPPALGLQYIRNVLLDDPNWNWREYVDPLVALADCSDPGDWTANDYASMAAYKARGGKLLMYHGTADAGIPTGSSTYFYKAVADALGETGESMADWFRYFVVPGMLHCSGTLVDAPWYFAGGGQAGEVGTDVHSVPGFSDPAHDALMALMDWVEKDEPVKSIIATTWVNMTDPDSGVLRQRPICPFPSRPVYNGAGDPDLADSWACAELCPQLFRPFLYGN
ncbi:hypothetical protein LRP88_14948 [Fusarium phalaenopsidis]|nr:Carboxylic ester hydrolase [Fusarium sp. Ph1]